MRPVKANDRQERPFGGHTAQQKLFKVVNQESFVVDCRHVVDRLNFNVTQRQCQSCCCCCSCCRCCCCCCSSCSCSYVLCRVGQEMPNLVRLKLRLRLSISCLVAGVVLHAFVVRSSARVLVVVSQLTRRVVVWRWVKETAAVGRRTRSAFGGCQEFIVPVTSRQPNRKSKCHNATMPKSSKIRTNNKRKNNRHGCASLFPRWQLTLVLALAVTLWNSRW